MRRTVKERWEMLVWQDYCEGIGVNLASLFLFSEKEILEIFLFHEGWKNHYFRDVENFRIQVAYGSISKLRFITKLIQSYCLNGLKSSSTVEYLKAACVVLADEQYLKGIEL